MIGILKQVAIDNPGTAGKFKLAAGLEYKGKLIAVGVNSYKTHPIMINRFYREHQIHLHAEADCIQKALKTNYDLSKCTMYVVRVKRNLEKEWVTGLAKPCCGCMDLICTHGIRGLEYTE